MTTKTNAKKLTSNDGLIKLDRTPYLRTKTNAKKLTSNDVNSIIRTAIGLAIVAAVTGMSDSLTEQLSNFDLGDYREIVFVALGTAVKVADRWARDTQ